MIGKIVKGTAQSAIALTIAFEAALLNMPDLVSSPIEDYMKDHDINAELIEGIRTDNIRVYEEHNSLANAHLTAFLVWNNLKGFDTISALLDPLKALPSMEGQRATIHSVDGKCMMFMPDPDLGVRKLLSMHLQIPESDLEISKKTKNLFRPNILLHELGHTQPMPDLKREYCADIGIPAHSKTYHEAHNVHPLMNELAADDFSINNLDDQGVIDFIIAYRAVTAFNHLHDISHDTAIYLDERYRRGSLSLRDEIPNHLDYKSELSSDFSSYIERYDSEELAPYKIYKAALDYLENHENTEGIRESSRRMVELYVEGIEYFAPTKSKSLQAERSSLNANIDASPTII